MEWYGTLRDFNVLSVSIRIVLAMLLGGCIGLEREKNGRPAGLRTHILVCIGSCMTALIGLYVWNLAGSVSDPLRVAAQVISGIGFLGVGTILVKGNDHITGLTTAAGLWTTAATGIAVGFGFYEGALLCTLVMMVTTAFLFRLEAKKKERYQVLPIYLEINCIESVNDTINWIKENYEIKETKIMSAKSATVGNVGLEVQMTFKSGAQVDEVINEIVQKENIVYAGNMES